MKGFGQRALVAWVLALVMLLGGDLAIARSPLLFHPTAFEDTRELKDLVLAQCFSAARKLHTPTRPGHRRVILLGSSRSLLAVWNEADVERLVPGESGAVQLDNLSIFGSAMEELEILSRLVPADEADLALLAIGPVELLGPPDPTHTCRRLLARGWEAGAGPAATPAARADRVVRGLWRLYGYREFAREALLDFVLRRQAPPRPERFESLEELAGYMRLERSGPFLEAARDFRQQPDLEHFVHYVREGRPEQIRGYRSRIAAYGEPRSAALAALDATLSQLEAGARRTMVLLMPESPLLAEDTAHELHRPELEAAAIRAIRSAAARHGAEVVDARDWIAAPLFLDFDHVLPSMSGFEARLAQEIARGIAL